MEALAGGGVWVGLFIGFLAGMAFQRARQALDNLRKTRDTIPGLKKAASGTSWRAVGWLLGVTAYAVAVLLVIVYIK
jgi:hypothetical protein